jgi:phosphoribosyl-ATP pyrophosphohydrolase
VGIPAESAYNDGFIDGQEDIIDEIEDIIYTWYTPHMEDKGLTLDLIISLIRNKKQDIDSL